MMIRCPMHGDVESIFIKPSKLLCSKFHNDSNDILADYDLEKETLLELHEAFGKRLIETLNNKDEYTALKLACQKANLNILDTYLQVMLSVWEGVKSHMDN